MSHRPEQVASLLRRTLQEILVRGLSDPRVRGLVSIVRVQVDPDLGEARVHVSVLPERHGRLTVQGLQAAAGHLQSRLLKALSMRRVPRLTFVLDDSIKQAAALDQALRAAEPAPDGDDPATSDPN